MGETALVESLVKDAGVLIRKLDATGTPPNFSVWYFYDDAEEWRLLLAGPAFDQLLPKQEAIAYRKVAEAMADLSLASLLVSQIKLIATTDPLPQVLRRLIGTPADGIVSAHFVDTNLSGIFIKEMFVLRSAVA